MGPMKLRTQILAVVALSLLCGFAGAVGGVWLMADSLKGDTGPRGIDGLRGPSGVQGPRGLVGPQGPAGRSLGEFVLEQHVQQRLQSLEDQMASDTGCRDGILSSVVTDVRTWTNTFSGATTVDTSTSPLLCLQLAR